MKQHFYFNTIRKMVGGFGTLFADIHIKQNDDTGQQVFDYRVPLSYGPRNAWVERMLEKERDNKDVARVSTRLPRITYEMGSMSYANDRATPQDMRYKRISRKGTLKEQIKSQMEKVPYDFAFTVSVIAKNMDDGLQIVEQILPFFRPTRALTINEIPELNITEDINITLSSVDSKDSWEGGLDNKRILSWDFNFIARGYVYPPITDAKLIKQVNAAIYDVNPDPDKHMETVQSKVSPPTAKESDDWKATVDITFPAQ